MRPPASGARGSLGAPTSAAQPKPGHQLLAEFVGTAAFFCAVIGSGIMAETLSAGNNGIALLANTLATVFALYVLIELLGPVSGAHFNPLVTFVLWSKGAKAQQKPARIAMLFIASQLLGAVAGAWLANAMFDLPMLQFSSKLRGGFNAAGQFSLETAVGRTRVGRHGVRWQGATTTQATAC